MIRIPTPWREPAHPSVVRLFEGLVQVYRSMKENQRKIDDLFDSVSSKIGFVVTTTLPVRFEVEDKGKLRACELKGEAIRGTLFAQEFEPFLKEYKGRTLENISPGTYDFYLIWSSALLLKVIPDPQERVAEPIFRAVQTTQAVASVGPEVREPAHWFDPRIPLPVEDVLTISAIDVVYPEFHLAERISASRMAIRRLGTYPNEPPHFVRPEVREPAHFREVVSREGFIEDLKALFQKYGM
jgi:hypothetical protein